MLREPVEPKTTCGDEQLLIPTLRFQDSPFSGSPESYYFFVVAFLVETFLQTVFGTFLVT